MRKMKGFAGWLSGVVGILTIFSVSAFGVCSGTQEGIWNTASQSLYSPANSAVQSDAADYYTITVGSNGIVNLTINNIDSSQKLSASLYPDGSCTPPPIWTVSNLLQNNSATSGDIVVGAGTYTLQVVGEHSIQDTDYNVRGQYISNQTPPIMGNVPNQLISVATAFNLDISAYVTLTDGDPIVSYTLTGALPAGLSFNSATGVLSGTPSEGGTFDLSVTATDNDGTSNSDSFTLSSIIVSGPPVMGDIPDQDIINGVPFILNIANYASATDSPIVSYTVTGTLPTGLDFNTTTGILSGTPTLNGTYTLSAYATDGEGDSNSDDFNITVSTAGVPSNLLIIKTPSTHYADVNETVRYTITIANETSTPMSNVTVTDTLVSYLYDLASGTIGSEITPPLNLNITIISSDFDCGVVSPDATSFSCTGNVPKRTGNSGVPGLARIVYTITTQSAPEPALLYNVASINGTTTETNASVIVSATTGGSVYTPPPDHADMIDAAKWVDIPTYNTGASKVIQTKIAAKTSVPLTAVHLDGNSNAAVYQITGGDPDLTFLVIPYVSDGMCSTQEILYDTDTGLPAVFNIANGQTTDTKNVTMPAYARQNARISVSYLDLDQLYLDSGVKCVYTSSTTGNLEGLGQCVNSANNYYDAFGLTAYERCQVYNGSPCESDNHGRSCGGDPGAADCTDYNPLYDNDLGCLMCTLNAFPDCSSDNFAIRPEKFEIISTHYNWAHILLSAEDYNTTINAYNYNSTTNTQAYNVVNANTAFDIATTKYNKLNIITPSMAGTASFAASSFDMADGRSVRTGVAGNEVAPLTFDDVGKINISVEDRVWSAVDNDDTPMNCDENGTYICGDVNVTFIPHHFDFQDLNITNNNGNPGTFTYIANEFTQMAARIHTKMRALNKVGNVTQNFSKHPLWENSVTVTPVVQVPATKYRFPSTNMVDAVTDANETIIDNLAIGFGTDGDTNGTKTVAWDETNTSQYLRFNFPREHNPATLPLPFDVNGSELNIMIQSTYLDSVTWAALGEVHSATIYGDRNGTAEADSSFVYGRIIPRNVRVFGNVDFTANAWYEVYMKGQIGGTTLVPSRNGTGWFINGMHDDDATKDGNGDVTVVLPNTLGLPGNSNIPAPPNSGTETYSFDGIDPTYSGIGHIDTDPWLWYGPNALPYADPDAATNINCLTHPCFNINIVPAIQKAGSAREGLEGDKGNKATTPGGIQYDYSPSVR